MMPASTPPPGLESTLVNPTDHGVIYIVISAIGLALVTLFVSLRVYIKVWVLQSAGWDDRTFCPHSDEVCNLMLY